MYSFPDLEPVCCSMSSSNCCFLTCKQISQEGSQVIWYSHPFEDFLQFVVIHTVKGFGIVNKTKRGLFLEIPCSFHDPEDVGNLNVRSFAFFKSVLNIWKFMVHVMLQCSMQDFEYNLATMGDECNWPVVWTFFSTTLLGNWDEDWPFPVATAISKFPVQICWHIECSTLIASSFRIWNSSAGLSSPTLGLSTAVLPESLYTSQSRMSGSGWVITP